MAKISNGTSQTFSEDLRKHCESIYYFLIILFAVLTFWIGAKFFNEIKNISRPDLSAPTISVQGSGSVFVRPDVGIVSFSSVVESENASEAQRESALAVNKAIKFLKDSGIEDKDIKTTSYNVSPLYDFPRGRREFIGFQVRQSVELKIRDLEKIGPLLSGLADLGISEVGSLVFEIDDLEKVKKQAREKAIIEAKQKAAELSALLGIRLGQIIAFNESGFFPTPYSVDLRTLGVAEESSVIPEVPTGENEILSNISITFEIK